MLHIASFHFETRLLSVLTFEGETVVHRHLTPAENPMATVAALGLKLADGATWNLHVTGLTATLNSDWVADLLPRSPVQLDPEPEAEAPNTEAPRPPYSDLSPTLVAALIDFASHEVDAALSAGPGNHVPAVNTAWGREDRARSLLAARGLTRVYTEGN